MNENEELSEAMSVLSIHPTCMHIYFLFVLFCTYTHLFYFSFHLTMIGKLFRVEFDHIRYKFLVLCVSFTCQLVETIERQQIKLILILNYSKLMRWWVVWWRGDEEGNWKENFVGFSVQHFSFDFNNQNYFEFFIKNFSINWGKDFYYFDSKFSKIFAQNSPKF